MAAPFILLAGTPDPVHELAEILQEGGYGVEVCPLEHLPEAAQAKVPDLLVLAAGLDQGVGPLRGLKSHESTREIPAIFAPANFSEAAAALALEAGADEFLRRPFLLPEVLGRVAVLLRLQRDRRLLLASREEFSRLFQETLHPLFFCDPDGSHCRVNPSLRRLLGFPGKSVSPVPLALEDFLYAQEDRERFRQVVSAGESHVKVHLRNREGAPVTVLLKKVGTSERSPEAVGFEVHPVGSVSPLKKALQGLVEFLVPSAREWLALMQLTPLLGGRYEKIKKLGQGNFGEVWQVLDTEALGASRQFVAKIPFETTFNPKFRKEAAILQRLSPHPGVVRLENSLEDGGRLIMIQEYAEGKMLSDYLGEELPRPFVERIILQLIDVVAHAHRHRVIHRDIKPNNIIIQPDGTLKLLDFGAAKILREKDISATVIGSRPFMAPEQIMGKSERRSDIWAIGVLMYLLYAGELPFYVEVEKLLIDMILEQEPLAPRELNPEIPPALEAIILKCLKKKVEERYANAAALKSDLLRHFPHYGTQAGRWPWIQ